jgi:hypothetical protein
MRVEGAQARRGEDQVAAATGQFREALARARGREHGAAETRSRPAPRSRAPGSAGEPAEGPPAPGCPPRPAVEREASPQPARAELEPVPPLAAAARALPAAVAAAGAAGGAPLAISFGRSLDVELRAVAAGVEVVLRPEPSLAHAARVELPRLVAALRGQGVAVARAEVRPHGSGGRRAR